ncbi:MAG: hypothetical protein M3Z98_08210 [Candidatus Dormibacteraeota bacterium]|nr:hypothetical protein [Candidatus Dormibacteraeota bacterium]
MAINRPPQPWQVYLYSRKNIVGSLLALLGLVLFFLGVIGPVWPAVVIGMYLVGALVTPSDRSWSLIGAESPSDLAGALSHQVGAIRGKVPDDVYQKVVSIQQTILGILPKIDRLGPGSQDAFVVQKTVSDYLPSTLQAYLNLPRAYAAVHRFSDGRTAAQVLIDQLTLLDRKLDEVADAVNKNDADALLANGRFLEDRFGGSALNLPPRRRRPAASD